jgi:SMODS and SLOG-associating 2TM effector domain family 5
MSINNDLKAYLDSLNLRIWKTKGSRFNAARRLNNNYQFSLISISILSIYGIAIPVIQGIVKNPQCQRINDIYNAISLILSVFTLTISLLEGAKNYQIRADKLHNNAIEISTLQREIEYLTLSESGSPEFIKKLGDMSLRYESLVKSCPENHEPEDYTFFMVQNRKDFNINRLTEFYIRMKLVIMNYWLYIFVLGIPPVLFLLYSSC